MRSLLFVLFALCASALFPMQAADALRLGVSKVEDYVQEDDGAPKLNNPGAFSFFAVARMAKTGAVTSATFTDPTAFQGKLNPAAREPLRLEYWDYYDDPLTLDENYPAGEYRMEIVGANDGRKTVVFQLPENFHPNTPRVLDWSGLQRVMADKPLEIKWEPFAEGTTNDLIQFVIVDVDGNEVFSTPTLNEGTGKPLDGTISSVTLPARLLKHGTQYFGVLIFGRTIERDTRQYPGAVALTMFVRQTAFSILTAGTEDFDKLKFELSFTYLAYGGDFNQRTTVEPVFPFEFDDCHVARLFVLNEEFVPALSGVTFSSPPGTALTNVESEFRYLHNDGVYFETPCLDSPTNALPGLWTVRYNDYPLNFNVPDPRPRERLVLPLPTVTLDGNTLRRVDWVYHDRNGTRLSRVPTFITNLVVELYNEANFLIYTSSNTPPALTSHGLTNVVDWTQVRRMLIAYQDQLGNWYVPTFYHSPPPGLGIYNDLLPLGSIGTPYSVQMIASNGVPPYRWSLDGRLPPGLTLNTNTGVISGVPERIGSFRFGIRVDDQKNFEYESYFIRITTNGPPVITDQPIGGWAEVGEYVYFEVSAEGTQPLSYQWLYNGKPIVGETNDSFLLLDVSTNNAGNYAVRVSNTDGSVLSAVAELEIRQPPVIITQPASQEVAPSTDVTFRVEVRSVPPIFYQWRRNGEVIEGATNATYTIPKALPGSSGTYSVFIEGGEGFVESEEASLTFTVQTLALTNRFANRIVYTNVAILARGSNGGANRDVGEPVHARIPGGSSVWLTWVAPVDGIATFNTIGSAIDTVLAVYTGEQLEQLVELVSSDDGYDIDGSDLDTASQVRFNARAGQRYQVAIDGVYGGQGEIVLEWWTDLTAARLPEILRQPVDAILLQGGTAVFSLLATNPPPAGGELTYLWFFNGNEIVGATNNTLIIPNVQDDDLGLYQAGIINDDQQWILSDLVVIEVSTDPDAIARRVSSEDKFANLSRQTNGLLSLTIEGQLITPLAGGGSVARGYAGSQVFSTHSSTTESGEPNHCGVLGGASQWYSYLAPTSGFLVINTDGSDFDTVLSVYTGNEFDFATLKQVACDNDGGRDGKDSRVGFQAVAGTLYMVAVDGVRGAKGTAVLNYSMAFPPRLETVRASNQTRIKVTGTQNGVFTIESSPNLRDWTTITTTNAPTGVIELNSRGLGVSLFYRAYQVN